MATRWARLAVAILAVVAVGAACGDDGGGEVTELGNGGGTTSSTGGATTTSTAGAGTEGACEVQGGVSTEGDEVMAALTEWTITPEPAQADPGTVTFVAENTGTEIHELVIVASDDPAGLPTDPETGAMDESQLPEEDVIGEIEAFPAGQVCEGNFALQAGDYALVCNVVEEEEDGTVESHYAEGMYTSFTVG